MWQTSLPKGGNVSAVSIPGAVLHRLFYNSRIFQVGKTASDLSWEYDVHGKLSVAYADQHVILVDSEQLASDGFGANRYWRTTSEKAKELEIALRKIDWPWCLEIDDGSLVAVRSTENATARLPLATSEGYDTISSTVFYTFDVLTETYKYGRINAPAAIPPDRFRKLSLVKPGDYPVDLLHIAHDTAGPLVLAKVGPSVRVVLSELDRDVLHKREDSDLIAW